MSQTAAVTIAPEATRGLASRARCWIELMRVRQWVKNGFVLAGVYFSDQLLDVSPLLHAFAAFIAFCFAASAVYCLNDILDRDADAAHPEKSHRPLARGAVSIGEAQVVLASCLVACAAVLVAASFPWQVPAMIATYMAVNVGYSVRWKHVSIVDLVVIASGFVIRLVAGTYAVGVEPTSWIVLCTGLLALFLALGKRRGDLEREGVAARQSLQGYTLNFIDQALGMLGAATLVFYAAFTVSPYALTRFGTNTLYLTAFPVAVGLLRYLQLVLVTGRYGSPTDIVLRDRPLQLIGLVWLALFAVIVYT